MAWDRQNDAGIYRYLVPAPRIVRRKSEDSIRSPVTWKVHRRLPGHLISIVLEIREGVVLNEVETLSVKMCRDASID
jgi:hypothetical protein